MVKNIINNERFLDVVEKVKKQITADDYIIH